MSTTSNSTTGRPKGSKNKQRDQADAAITRCRKCGSTERAAYYNKTEREIGGLDPSDEPYTHIVWRRTSCMSCGQHRVDRFFENRKGKKK